jgi:hypothetical protein
MGFQEVKIQSAPVLEHADPKNIPAALTKNGSYNMEV